MGTIVPSKGLSFNPSRCCRVWKGKSHQDFQHTPGGGDKKFLLIFTEFHCILDGGYPKKLLQLAGTPFSKRSCVVP